MDRWKTILGKNIINQKVFLTVSICLEEKIFGHIFSISVMRPSAS
jgi:hypothetical protein